MSPNGEDNSLPSEARVKDALQRLCTVGVELWWVRERGGILLDLQCVQQRAAKDFTGEKAASALALIEILRELVLGKMGETEYGNILRIVLALEDRYIGLRADERRTIAGQEFRDGARQVKATTIRTLHEPVARERLAKLLLNLEQQTRQG